VAREIGKALRGQRVDQGNDEHHQMRSDRRGQQAHDIGHDPDRRPACRSMRDTPTERDGNARDASQYHRPQMTNVNGYRRRRHAEDPSHPRYHGRKQLSPQAARALAESRQGKTQSRGQRHRLGSENQARPSLVRSEIRSTNSTTTDGTGLSTVRALAST
jgi:hypothetical protein